jgi:serine/threonine-protein kinase RsbW
MITEHIELGNRMEELARLTQWLEDICNRHGVSDRTRFNIELVLEEAVTNVTSYAFKDESGEHTLKIDLQISPEEISITLQDDGVAFNPLGAAAPDMAGSIEDAQIGGLGIHLIRSYTKLVDYFRNEGTNNLVMVLDR